MPSSSSATAAILAVVALFSVVVAVAPTADQAIGEYVPVWIGPNVSFCPEILNVTAWDYDINPPVRNLELETNVNGFKPCSRGKVRWDPETGFNASYSATMWESDSTVWEISGTGTIMLFDNLFCLSSDRGWTVATAIWDYNPDWPEVNKFVNACGNRTCLALVNGTLRQEFDVNFTEPLLDFSCIMAYNDTSNPLEVPPASSGTAPVFGTYYKYFESAATNNQSCPNQLAFTASAGVPSTNSVLFDRIPCQSEQGFIQLPRTTDFTFYRVNETEAGENNYFIRGDWQEHTQLGVTWCGGELAGPGSAFIGFANPDDYFLWSPEALTAPLIQNEGMADQVTFTAVYLDSDNCVAFYTDNPYFLTGLSAFQDPPQSTATPAPIIPEGNIGGSGTGTQCISAESTVALKSGIKKNVGDLVIGDIVMTLDHAGALRPTRVYAFLDRAIKDEADFIVIELNGVQDEPLKVTPKHLVFRGKTTDSKSVTYEAVFADAISAGDFLRTSRGNKRVLSVEVVKKTGYAAPLTEAGSLLADDVLVSCYAHTGSHDAVHALFVPLRFIVPLQSMLRNAVQRLGPPALEGFQSLVEKTPLEKVSMLEPVKARLLALAVPEVPSPTEAQEGVHWYPAAISSVYQFAAKLLPVDKLFESLGFVGYTS
mmetsp:Transcript_20689/g.55229  ORF Transcript_20689/g.55229 Transcript_20689/m.55229 type:complete len:654 (-) Transcript_20689:267-2228(-)